MLATGKPVPEVAKEHGYSKHTFYRVINNERFIPAVRDLIDGIIAVVSVNGQPVSEIWPDQSKNKEAA